MSNNKSIGIVGLGQIGGGVGMTLVRRGFNVWGYDTAPDALRRAQENGIRTADSLAELTTACDTIATSLSSLSAIEETYFGTGGLSSSGNADLLTIECSTVPPDFARRVTRAINDTGKMAVEASVVGLGRDADAGNLFFIVSGSAQAVSRAEEFLNGAGRGHVHIGPSGSAAVAKLLNNAIGAVAICAIAEALTLARDLKIDPTAFVRAVAEGQGAGYSVIFERHAPYMACWRESKRRANPIGLKDAKAVAGLIGDRGPAFPHLTGMTSVYQSVLPSAAGAVAETLARHAEDRLQAVSARSQEISTAS